MSKLLGFYGTTTLSHLGVRAIELEKKLRELLLRDDRLSYEFIGKNRDLIFTHGIQFIRLLTTFSAFCLHTAFQFSCC
jgi:hypothetical protein